MLVAVDVGNTQTNLGLIDDEGTILHQWRMATNPTNTPDELLERVRGFFAMSDFKLEHVRAFAVSCVVPLLAQQWKACAQAIKSIDDVCFIEATRDCGIVCTLKELHQVGADRIANAVGALTCYGPSTIVVDFGTATNIDVVDRTGAFVGGVIMPGILMGAHALFSRAAKLSSVELTPPAHTIGTNTEEAVQSGIMIGSIACVEGLASRIKQELHDPEMQVIATGGSASMIASATSLFDHVDQELTVRGMYHIWKHYNKTKQ